MLLMSHFDKTVINFIAYPTTSHGIWRFIPHRGDYIPRSEARCGINPISHGWLLDKYFILSKGNFKQNKTLKNMAIGYENLFDVHKPIRK